jgi:hypothetical protein
VFDPEGNVFVPGTRETKRKIRKDGKFLRPRPDATELYSPAWERGVPWTDEEAVGADGQRIEDSVLWERYGRENEWSEGVEIVVVRPPLVEVFKDRTSVEAVLFIHRCGAGRGGGGAHAATRQRTQPTRTHSLSRTRAPLRRATPAWMRDLHYNYTSTVRDWLEVDTELARLGLDSIEEALVKTGARGPYLPEELAVMSETTTTVDFRMG